MKNTAAVIVLVISLLINIFLEAVDFLINYQGKLDENGAFITASRSMVFNIYNVPTGGSFLWTSGGQSINVVQ